MIQKMNENLIALKGNEVFLHFLWNCSKFAVKHTKKAPLIAEKCPFYHVFTYRDFSSLGLGFSPLNKCL